MLNSFTFFPRRSYRRWLYPLLSLVVALTVVVGTPQIGRAIDWFDLIRGGIQVLQLSNVSDRQEVELGQEINEQLLSSEVRIYNNPEITRYVNEIGQRLAQQSDRPNIPYTFQVVADRGINAFATMGGFVYVNAGLLATADNESELASVMAHELGHITGRHALKQMRQTAIARGLSSAAGLDRNTAVQIGLELAVRRPRSRSDEFDADRRGLANLQRAGYAPSGMTAFMAKLLKSSGSVPTVLSTHPNTQDRIAALQRAIPAASANAGQGLDNVAYKQRIRSMLRS